MAWRMTRLQGAVFYLCRSRSRATGIQEYSAFLRAFCDLWCVPAAVLLQVAGHGIACQAGGAGSHALQHLRRHRAGP